MYLSGNLLMYIQKQWIWCGNPTLVTTWITQTIFSPWAHPPIEIINQAPWAGEGACDVHNHHHCCSIIQSCNYHDSKDCNHKPAACDCKCQNYYVEPHGALGLVLTQDHILVVWDIPLAITDCTFMMTTNGIGNETSLPQFTREHWTSHPWA